MAWHEWESSSSLTTLTLPKLTTTTTIGSSSDPLLFFVPSRSLCCKGNHLSSSPLSRREQEPIDREKVCTLNSHTLNGFVFDLGFLEGRRTNERTVWRRTEDCCAVVALVIFSYLRKVNHLLLRNLCVLSIEFRMAGLPFVWRWENRGASYCRDLRERRSFYMTPAIVFPFLFLKWKDRLFLFGRGCRMRGKRVFALCRLDWMMSMGNRVQ